MADYLLSLPIKGDVEDEAEKVSECGGSFTRRGFAGGKDIIAEMVSDDLKVRENIYNNMLNYGKSLQRKRRTMRM